MKKKGYRVIPQMFDVKPVDQAGQLNMEKISKVEKVVKLNAQEKIQPEKAQLKISSVGKINSQGQLKRTTTFPRPIRKQIKNAVYHNQKPQVQPIKETKPLAPIEFPWQIKGFEHYPIVSIKKDDLVRKQAEKSMRQGPKKIVKPVWPVAGPEKIYQSDPLPKLAFAKQLYSQARQERKKINEPAEKKIINEPVEFYQPLSQASSEITEPMMDRWNNLRLAFRPAFGFAMMMLVMGALFTGGLVMSRGFQLKDSVMVKGQQAIGQLALAKEEIEKQNFAGAEKNLENAREEFQLAQKQIDSVGGDLLNIFSSLPYFSKASSGKNLIDAGEKLTQVTQNFSKVLVIFSQIENPLKTDGNASQKSLIDVFAAVNEQVIASKKLLLEAQDNISKVNVEDLPAEYQSKFEKIKETLPLSIKMIEGFEENYQIVLDILGHNGPRKYLFIFQNNQEMRATGGFIGSYGIMDIRDGHIKNLMIDGIYNPDGQLRENVVPPKPIQKISAAWSTHDANWFPNFPTSAEKIAWFYEKTGGPTVDGVISITPTVLQKMLEITGPIEMPQYETTVDKDNFIEKTQYEVEVDYDKQENKPKQFIADLAPVILDKVMSVKDATQMSKVVKVLTEALNEKHILIYANNYNLQQLISRQGWSGEVLQTQKDYLMVINSNINGYKTDGVIEETISHQAQIQADGSIIDTVKVRRKHNGGDTPLEWWNKVNSDYMRVYVPQGSKLLSVKGQTREFNQSPLDYDQLGFRKDPQVQQQEDAMIVDEQSGTRIYTEENKTVFANWVYVSPKETAEIEYQYVLPFKIDLEKNKDHVDTYSLLAQKQAGSIGSKFISDIELPTGLKMVWRYPETAETDGSKVHFSSALSEDRFLGFVIQKPSQN